MIRIFQVKNADALRSLLKGVGAQGEPKSHPAFERLQRLNPHVDLAKLKAGTVLLLPDIPDLDSQGDSLAGEAFDGLAADAANGLKAAGARMRDGFERRAAEHKELAAVFKSAGVKRLMESDEVLRKQVAEAEERFKAEQKEAAESLAVADEAGKALASELAALGRLFK